MVSRSRRAPSHQNEERAEKRERKRVAKAAGKGWLTVALTDSEGVTWKSDGPVSDDQAFIVCMAAKGLDPLEIAEEVASFKRPGGERESRRGKASALRSLLEELRDGTIDPVFQNKLMKLRDEWLKAGTPGL